MTDTSPLLTIRDFLRYAISSFRTAGLSHGHGATNALDEAAFIILESLKLPVDDINPWLDAHLLESEKTTLAKLIEDRITTRKPAAYLLKRTYMHGTPFYVDERVIIPRSYIGEMLVKGLFDEAGLGFDFPIVVYTLAESVDDFSIRVDVADEQPFVSNGQVAEAVSFDRGGIRADFIVWIESGATTAGNDKRGFQAFEFEVLEVVIVATEIEMDAGFFQQRCEVLDQLPGIAVFGIRIDGMMADDDSEGCAR